VGGNPYEKDEVEEYVVLANRVTLIEETLYHWSEAEADGHLVVTNSTLGQVFIPEPQIKYHRVLRQLIEDIIEDTENEVRVTILSTHPFLTEFSSYGYNLFTQSMILSPAYRRRLLRRVHLMIISITNELNISWISRKPYALVYLRRKWPGISWIVSFWVKRLGYQWTWIGQILRLRFSGFYYNIIPNDVY